LQSPQAGSQVPEHVSVFGHLRSATWFEEQNAQPPQWGTQTPASHQPEQHSPEPTQGDWAGAQVTAQFPPESSCRGPSVASPIDPSPAAERARTRYQKSPHDAGLSAMFEPVLGWL
jgi:hypothetical protein